MDRALVRLVWSRARDRCEYCLISQDYDEVPFEVDHIIAKKHRGPTESNNLALSCFACNSSKGSNIAGRDIRTGKLAPLFHPRRHKWTRHFRWAGPTLIGKTPIGRVTIEVLNINDSLRVELRRELAAEGELD